MSQPRCQTCRFFVAGDEQLGECRVAPPTAHTFGGLRARFPEVNPSDWCGHFQPPRSSTNAEYPWNLPPPSEN
jgi:hypothetical protein